MSINMNDKFEKQMVKIINTEKDYLKKTGEKREN